MLEQSPVGFGGGSQVGILVFPASECWSLESPWVKLVLVPVPQNMGMFHGKVTKQSQTPWEPGGMIYLVQGRVCLRGSLCTAVLLHSFCPWPGQTAEVLGAVLVPAGGPEHWDLHLGIEVN